MPDTAGEVVAGAQVEAADLRGRHVDVVGAGEVGLVVRAQEAEAVLQDFQYALGPDAAAGLGVGAQDVEDHVLLAGAGDAFLDAEFLGQFQQLHRILLFELGEVDQAFRIAGIGLVAGDVRRQAVGVAALAIAAARMAAAPAPAAFGPVAALGLTLAAVVAGGAIGFGGGGRRADVL